LKHRTLPDRDSPTGAVTVRLDDPAQRPVRSFVLRQSRTSDAQRRAFDDLLPRFGLAWTGQPIDFAAAFGRTAPVVVEIGFGMGEETVQVAAARPDVDFLGIEVHLPGVGNLLKRIGADGLHNVRVVRHDAVEVLTHMVAPQTLAGLHIWFPDPWPKKRHHKRRLIQPAFVALAASRLAVGGYLHLATDWAEYAQQMLDVLSAEPTLANSAIDGFAPRPAWRPETRFEKRGRGLGHDVFDLVFVTRKPVATASTATGAS
jgi:tRNA (guanine-N7-)-methyltransferase